MSLGAAAFAGCSGGSETDGGDGHSSADGGTASSAGCPSRPLSYTRKEIQGSPGIAFEVPAGTSFTVNSDGTDQAPDVITASVTLSRLNDGANDFLVDLSGFYSDESVSDLEVRAGLVEVTSEYDLAVEGARVVAIDREQRTEPTVHLPTADGRVSVILNSVPAPSVVTCSEAATATVERLIETMETVE